MTNNKPEINIPYDLKYKTGRKREIERDMFVNREREVSKSNQRVVVVPFKNKKTFPSPV